MVNALTNYVKFQKIKLIESVKGTVNIEEEAIHDFRLTINKTRTILDFIDYWSYGQSSKTEIYRQLRPMFQRTGKIRELQTHQTLLPEFTVVTELDLDFLVKKINYKIIRNKPFLEKEMKKFKKTVPKIYSKINRQIALTASGKQRVDAAANYQVRLEKAVQKQLSEDQPNLPRIRRFIKQKVYIFDSFQESELLSFYKEFRAEWDILESSIRKWHDQVIFLQWLVKGLKWKRLDDEQYKTMMKLIAHLRSSTKRMEKQLIQSIPRVSFS
ncbi:MAG: hypothetical protein U9N86_11050 [Bacteroidota bacterium]|nr:hypothetical protein [Bacteroidota bacterium]